MKTAPVAKHHAHNDDMSPATSTHVEPEAPSAPGVPLYLQAIAPELAEADGGIQRKLDVDSPGVPPEGNRDDHPNQAPAFSDGRSTQLPAQERAFFEPRLGHDLSAVRVHTDASSAESVGALHATAFTHGSDIYFGRNRWQPGTTSGRQLLGHELTHVLQQRSGLKPAGGVSKHGDALERHADVVAEQVVAGGSASGLLTSLHPSGSTASAIQKQDPPAPPAPSVNVNEVPLEWVQEPGRNDILAFFLNGQLVALPATGAAVFLQPPTGAHVPTEPVFTVPTVAKEGLIAVSIGGRTGFMVDAGGRQAVVFPGALSAIQQALGVESIRGIVCTHIHADHVRSFVNLVRTLNIRPENLHYPEAFAVNPSAPGSTFARAIRTVQTDPSLRALGHGTNAAYSAIPTPNGGAIFHQTLREGNAVFDLYGLTADSRPCKPSAQGGGSNREPIPPHS